MLPILLNDAKTSIVVFGYGKASQIKVQGIVKAGIKCCVISPSIENEISTEDMTFICDIYKEVYLSKGQIVIAATGSPELNRNIAIAARKHGKMVLNLSDGVDSDFHMMSWRRRGPITVALSTGSCAPSESKRLIEALMDTVDDETIERISLLGSIRKKVKQLGISPVKPVINRFVDLPTDQIRALDALRLEVLADEIDKGLRV